MTAMNASDVAKRVEAAGLRCAGLPLERLGQAVETVATAYRSGGMGSAYTDASLEELLQPSPPAFAESVWVVAVPCPRLRYRFHTADGVREILLPAMYLYSEPMRRAEEAMREAHAAAGAECEWGWLPVRFLAASAGMGMFGRNNMLYLDGLGSFPWLTGFYSSLAVADAWREPERMARCRGCSACVAACPGGALARDSRLMRSDRCLNYVTEYPERGAGWFNPVWQRELLGCLACQLVCPANRGYSDWIEEGPVFSREETEELAAAVDGGRVSPAVLDKLGGSDIAPYIGGVAWRVAMELVVGGR